ncbi:MAG TPA: hypothetical protein DCW68_02545 [Rhodospirillaceae bacterium]|nr:MAG: hypothetical protein A2018_05520 [Alphaproteobacteria bacterium GWF2_58_20]HAU28973.1 hypothetical protein [Rhodospirillaceae bacterium]
MLRFLEKLIDALAAVMAFMAGRRQAKLEEAEDALGRANEAVRIRARLAADPAYRDRMRDQFRRK